MPESCGGRRAISVLEAYSDESGVHDSALVFAIAGYVAPAEEWEKFARRWSPVLEREGIKKFHMSDCEAGRGDFEGWSRERRDELVARLVEAVASVAALGHGCAIVRGSPSERGGITSFVTEDPYLGAFGHHVLGLSTRAGSFLGAEDRVGFIFDSHEEWGARACKQYEAMKSASEFDQRHRFGLLAFESCDGSRFLPLHAADLLAWEIRRFLEERTRDAGVRPRHSLERLSHSERVHVCVHDASQLEPVFWRTLDQLATGGTPIRLIETDKWRRRRGRRKS